MEVPSVQRSLQGHSNQTTLDVLPTLWDLKTNSPSEAYFNNPNGDVKAVDRRQDRVAREYRRKAKRLDHELHGTDPNDTGPVEERLNEYGVNGEVLGLALGCFGEVSDHVRLVRDWIVAHRTSKELQWSCVHPKVLLARYRGRFNCRLGALLHAGWARMLLRRAHEEVYGPSSHFATAMPGMDDDHWDPVDDYRPQF